MNLLKTFVKELEKITLKKYNFIKTNVIMSADKVVAIALEGEWEKTIGTNGYIEVDLSDFCPEILQYGAETAYRTFYLKYSLAKPIRSFNGKKIKEVSYQAIPLLAIMHLFKKMYGEVHIYLNVKRPAPLIIRPSKLGERGKRYYEGLIAPRVI